MALGEIIRRREHSSVKFSDRITPKKSLFSLILAVVSWGLLITLVTLSVKAGGSVSLEEGWYLGLGGLAALALSVTGLILAVRCFAMVNIYRRLPIAGVILNGILIVLCLVLYVLGLIG